jgi:hypothetical protein
MLRRMLSVLLDPMWITRREEHFNGHCPAVTAPAQP